MPGRFRQRIHMGQRVDQVVNILLKDLIHVFPTPDLRLLTTPMLRKIIYFINPISGTGNRSEVQETIIRETRNRSIDFEILHTSPEGDYRFLPAKIRQGNFTDVVICGGDGSISAVSAAILGENVRVGIIPIGSGNGLALAAKIPRSVVRALHVIFEGRNSHIDGFYLNNRFSCMLCGVGFDAQVAHDFAGQAKRGLGTYVKCTARNFFSAPIYSFDLLDNGNVFSTEAFFITVANSNQFGNHFTIAPRASLNDGLLDVIIVNKMSKLLLPFSLLRQMMGGNARLDFNGKHEIKKIMYFRVPSLTIVNKEKAPLHIDGDPQPTEEILSIRVVPNAFKLIQPWVRGAAD